VIDVEPVLEPGAAAAVEPDPQTVDDRPVARTSVTPKRS
jgi:hypothetical protein